MGAALIFALEIALFIGAIIITNRVKAKPVPVKVRVDSDRRTR